MTVYEKKAIDMSKDQYLLPWILETDSGYYVRQSLTIQGFVVAFVWEAIGTKGIERGKWIWYLTIETKEETSPLKLHWTLPEEAMTDADRKLIELGYVLLTEGQAERLSVLI
jgi:hypothetical protein